MGSPNEQSLSALELELKTLERMPLHELRVFWGARWGRAPELRSVGLLRRMIAWRLQTALLGGLDDDTMALLQRKSVPLSPQLPAGSRVTREYRGVLHHVDVCEGAYLYQGREYRSLSKIASEITGTHWNGPKFFGLRAKRVAQ